MAALPRRDRPCGRLEPRYFRARTALGEVCDVDNWVRHTAACDVSFPLRVGFDEHPLMLDGRVSLFGEGWLIGQGTLPHALGKNMGETEDVDFSSEPVLIEVVAQTPQLPAKSCGPTSMTSPAGTTAGRQPIKRSTLHCAKTPASPSR